MHEAEQHEKNSFLTLTYDEENIPTDGSLDVEHWKAFAKRVRKRIQTQKEIDPDNTDAFRYFHCGEYGDVRARPHYHAAIFGYDWSRDRKTFKIHNGNPLFRSEELEGQWTLGHSTIGALTFASAAYVARYAMKKVYGDQAEKHYNGRKPEYTTMSRKPGLGKAWIDKWHKPVYENDSVIINGKESRPPKYYDKIYELLDPEHMERIRKERKYKALTHAKDTTPDRLDIRERVQLLKLKEQTREIE